MNILLIFGSALSLVLALIILIKDRDGYFHHKVLSLWLVLLSLDLIRTYMLYIKGHLFLLGLGYTLPLLIVALLFIYIESFINKHTKFNVNRLWHFVPFVLANIYMYFFIYSKSTEWRLDFFGDTSFSSRPLIFNLILISAILVYPVYILWIYILLWKHVRKIKMIYSCREQIDLFWINYLLVSISALWLITTSLKYMSGYYDHLHYNDVIMAFHFLQLIIIMVIGYWGLKQGMVYISRTDFGGKARDIIKYKTSGLSSEQAKGHLPILQKYMEANKPYLNSQLTISGLAEQIKVPSNYLSQIINEQLQVNFFEFINSYRVKEVQRHIADNHDKKFTLLALALESGFNSKSSFNSIFKKQTGLTPREYTKKYSRA